MTVRGKNAHILMGFQIVNPLVVRGLKGVGPPGFEPGTKEL